MTNPDRRDLPRRNRQFEQRAAYGNSANQRRTGRPGQSSDHVKAIAFTAGFHFGFIEQGGTSLYATCPKGNQPGSSTNPPQYRWIGNHAL
jgi:hypothetical protein